MKKNRVFLKHDKNWGFDENKVLVLARQVLRRKNLFGVELSLVFVGRKKAKDLNVKYRKKDYVPQVLAFPMSREKDVDGYVRLGDVVICSQKLKYEAKFLNKDVYRVLKDWLEHGIGNLLK